MSLLVLGESDVEQALPLGECVEVMAEALAGLARGAAYQPLRGIVSPPGAAGLMGLMPAYRGGDEPMYGLKAICVFGDNPKRGLDAHQGGVFLFSGETGEPIALLNGSALTAIRTAAATAAATRALARGAARTLAIIGTGVQARRHLAALALVRPFERVKVASRTSESARTFVESVRGTYAFDVEPAEDAESAVRGADVVVAVTNASEPVIRGEWISEGAHVNLAGACFPTAREADAATLARARVFVDNRESAMNESGDVLIGIAEGAFGPEHIVAELGEVLAGLAPGRTSAGEITLFKSLGIGVEDLAAADRAYRNALRDRLGTRVPF